MAFHLARRTLICLLSLFVLYFALIDPQILRSNLDSYLDFAETGPSRTALVLTAHPDDEAMFFSPTILSLTSTGWAVRALCLSTGNSSGLGEVRKKEVYASYDVLGVGAENVDIIDHPELQDSMTSIWDPKVIALTLAKYLEEHPVSSIITFDHVGITRHPNHIVLPASLSHLPMPRPQILILRSPSLLRKFTGPLDYIIELASHMLPPQLLRRHGHPPKAGDPAVMMISTMRGWFTGVRAMLQHRSQMVWFRWLYLASSKLMWINELDALE